MANANITATVVADPDVAHSTVQSGDAAGAVTVDRDRRATS